MKFSDGDHWITPPWFMYYVGEVGTVVLDPFAGESASWGAVNLRPGDGNSLDVDWSARMESGAAKAAGASPSLAYSNPAYSDAWIGPSVCKIAEEAAAWRAAERPWGSLALLPASTGAAWFQDYVFGTANAACFVRGRIRFIDSLTMEEEGSGRFWSVAAFWGPEWFRSRFFEAFADLGELAKLCV